MKSISKIVVVLAMILSSSSTFAQIKNVKSETVKIYGNCGMCKSTIEKAGNVKNTASVEWNKDTKVATLKYDSTKTNTDEILKRIALVGYDSQNFLAPDDVYAQLPECCHYDRVLKPISKNQDAVIEMKHHHTEQTSDLKNSEPQNASQLKAVFDNYFRVKDGLVQTDAATSSAKAADLLQAIEVVDMSKLSTEEHTVWMNVMKDLAMDAQHISESKDVASQRDHFRSLSKNMYKLIKVSKVEKPIYYQHCPMANKGEGANWLSKEESIKNPYYGSQMLTCGSIQETIK